MDPEKIVFSEAIDKLVKEEGKLFEGRPNKYGKFYLLGQDGSGIIQVVEELTHNGTGCIWMIGVNAEQMNQATVNIYKKGFTPAAMLRIKPFDDGQGESYVGGYYQTMKELPIITYNPQKNKYFYAIRTAQKVTVVSVQVADENRVIQKKSEIKTINRK